MKLLAIAIAFVVVAPIGGAAQQPPRINIYRFVLGVDVPESAAFVAMGIGPPSRLGSAPKPVVASLGLAVDAGSTARAGAFDVAPYYLVGGGVRDRTSYRSNSVAGRLMRVLTKTIVSVGASHTSDDPSAMLLAVGARATLHDPHDPVVNSALVEDIDAVLGECGAELPDPAEDVTECDGDTSAVFSHVRRQMRARSGDAQVSAGWGMSTRVAGGDLVGDSLGAARHSGWLAAQYTASGQFDLLATVELRDMFRSRQRFVAGIGIRRKGPTGDTQLGVRYEARTETVHPSLTMDLRLSTRFGVVTWIDTSVSERQLGGNHRLRVGLLARWFVASDVARF